MMASVILEVQPPAIKYMDIMKGLKAYSTNDKLILFFLFFQANRL